MKTVELYVKVRQACHRDGMSGREAAKHFGVNRRTVSKILEHSEPPGYRRSKPARRPKLDGFTGIIDAILQEDTDKPKKQRHTAKRIFERLRAEHGFTGGITIVKDYVRENRRLNKEVFVPLEHPPGHAQVDFGEALAIIGGVQRKIHYMAFDLPHSDAPFVKAYPAETTEAFCDAHVAAFAFFGGIPVSLLYDNTKIAVSKIRKDGKRDLTEAFTRLCELELIERERRMVERRIKAARFPAVKSLDSFDFKAIPSLNKVLVNDLVRCHFVERRENVIALGPSGTGKTHVALGLGLAACQKGLKVRFATASVLVHELMEAHDEQRLLRLQKQLADPQLLIIDELGFVPLSKTGAELLFEVISQRYERGSIVITSNLPFDEWTETFGSERLTGALLDRLTHHVHILEMNGESYRLTESRKSKNK